ncbi:MAG: glycosyltransferase [Nitrospirota bacterium]
MRILFITGSFPPMKCGVGDYTACLANALVNHKDVHVAILTGEMNSNNAHSVAYEIFPVIKKWRINEFLKIRSVIRHWKPDIVHIQYPTQGYYGGGYLPFLLPLLLYVSRIKVAQTWHEYYTTVLNPLLLFKAVIPSTIVAVRPNYWEHLTPIFRRIIRKDRIAFIPNASSLPHISLSIQERQDIRSRFASSERKLIAYFGFFYPFKGADMLFKIADPRHDHVVFIGPFDDKDPYHRSLRDRAMTGTWAGNATITGFLPPDEAARILAAADAVILPFRKGGGMWNTSLHGAALQGTFIITTSLEQQGYDETANIYYARQDDLATMQEALIVYAGRRNSEENIRKFTTWDDISNRHIHVYRSALDLT